MKNYRTALKSGKYYHIFNRGNNKERIFLNNENYSFFLKQYQYYLIDYVDTYAYCLLPNHFHLLIYLKENVPHLQKVEHLVSKQFRFLFTSYAKAINKQQNRSGALFIKPFKRLEITNDEYLTNLIFYIHANPQIHGIIKDFKKYRWSSYQSILSNGKTNILRSEVINWFDTIENFIAFHNEKIEIKKIEKLIIE